MSGFRGYPKTFYSEEFAESHHHLLETAFYFPGVAARNLPSFGLAHKEWMKKYPHFLSLIVLELDESRESNRVVLRDGEPVLNYRLTDASVSNLVHSMRSSAKFFLPQVPKPRWCRPHARECSGLRCATRSSRKKSTPGFSCVGARQLLPLTRRGLPHGPPAGNLGG